MNVAASARLETIQVFEASGRIRRAFTENEPPELTPAGPNVVAHLALEGMSFSARYRSEFVTEEFHLIADIGATYLLEGLDEEPDREALTVFASTSCMLHVWPFLRESLRTSATRIDVEPPLLPLMLQMNGTGPDAQASTVET